MRELHDPSELQRRTELYVRDEENAGRLPKRSFAVLRWATDRQRPRARPRTSETCATSTGGVN